MTGFGSWCGIPCFVGFRQAGPIEGVADGNDLRFGQACPEFFEETEQGFPVHVEQDSLAGVVLEHIPAVIFGDFIRGGQSYHFDDFQIEVGSADFFEKIDEFSGF